MRTIKIQATPATERATTPTRTSWPASSCRTRASTTKPLRWTRCRMSAT
jgi:hypothetical protein